MVDEVGDPPLKFLKAAERVKLVPPTTHRLGQGGIPGLKAAFVSTLPLLQFFSAKIRFCSHIGLLFGIPFAMRVASQKCVKWLLVRKGTILFVSQTVSQETVCENLRFAK